jgi:hypothetical protein
MIHPLDGARLKVVRAQEHLDTFKSDASTFLRPDPYRFESEVYGEYWWVKPKLTSHPDPHLSVVIGDVVTNIRAALDYIIWELARRYFNPPINLDKPFDRVILTFPMLLANPLRRQGHINHLDGLSRRGIPAGAIKIMKEAQADVSGNDSLRWLYELVNTDKHRTPLLTIGSFSAAQIEIRDYKGQNWLIRSDIIKDGVTLNTKDPDLLQFVRENPANVNVQASVQITFEDVAVPLVPADATLEQIIETVANLIPRFDQFF